MSEFISDEQMRQLEDSGQASAIAPDNDDGHISDEDMRKLEDAGHASHEAPQISQLESGVRGGAQGLTMGFADELAGAKGTIDQALLGKVDLASLADTYRQQRDASRQSFKQAHDANPATYTTGEIAGGVGGAFVPGLNAVKGIKGAAMLGGAMGLGQTEADLTQGELSDAALDVGKGAVLGGAIGKLGETVAPYIAKGMKKGGDALSNLATNAQYGALGAKAKDIAMDLGLGGTLFPAKAGEVAQRGMAETLKENGVLQLTGGSKAVLDNIDKALASNKQTTGVLAQEIAQKTSQTASNTAGVPQGSIPQSSSLLNGYNRLIEGFKDRLNKGYGQSGTANKIGSDAVEYSRLLQDAGDDIGKLGELRDLLGNQLSKTDWSKMPPELSAKKEIIKKTYQLIKTHMEGLADGVSPEAGSAMRKLTQDAGNLESARAIAFAEHTKDLNAPMIGPLDMMGIGTAIATHSPHVLAATAAKKGLELVTGNSIDKLSKIATAKALDSMATAMQAAEDPAARGLAASLVKLSQNESLIARVSGMSALLSDPKTKNIVAQYMPQSTKGIEIKTPATTNGGIKNASYDKNYNDDSLNEMQSKITPEMGSAGSQLRNVIEAIKGKDQNGRTAMMFALQQNPAYRPLLEKLRNKNEGLSN